jgi:hypothetical protein
VTYCQTLAGEPRHLVADPHILLNVELEDPDIPWTNRSFRVTPPGSGSVPRVESADYMTQEEAK